MPHGTLVSSPRHGRSDAAPSTSSAPSGRTRRRPAAGAGAAAAAGAGVVRWRCNSVTRFIAAWRTTAGSPDTDVIADLPMLRQRSRDLERNAPVAAEPELGDDPLGIRKAAERIAAEYARLATTPPGPHTSKETE